MASEKLVQDIEQMQLAHKSIVAINETKIRKKIHILGEKLKKYLQENGKCALGQKSKRKMRQKMCEEGLKRGQEKEFGVAGRDVFGEGRREKQRAGENLFCHVCFFSYICILKLNP